MLASRKFAALTDLLERVGARVKPGYRARYYRYPRLYWERRHARAGASLEGVGLLGLESEGNFKDYECKWRHIKAALDVVDPLRTQRVVDAGCGNGWFTTRVADLGFAVEGLDFSERAIDIAKRTNQEKAINWHVSELSEFRGWRRYGVAMCIDVLFHIMNDLDWHKALSNLADMVVEDGYLLIQDALAEVPVKVGDPERTHVNFRTEDAYREALNGWELLEHDSYCLPAEGSRKDLMVFRRFVP